MQSKRATVSRQHRHFFFLGVFNLFSFVALFFFLDVFFWLILCFYFFPISFFYFLVFILWLIFFFCYFYVFLWSCFFLCFFLLLFYPLFLCVSQNRSKNGKYDWSTLRSINMLRIHFAMFNSQHAS